MKKYSRRDFLYTAGSGTLAVSMLPLVSCQESPKKPNILLIHTDQHRVDCLGAYGNGEIDTKNIDALAADGEIFKNHFCPYPVCTPSRYSLLSGLYVHQHRGWTNHSTLGENIDTFPKILRNAGYKTKAIGKMHFTPTYLDVGFDELMLSEQDGPGRWDDDYHRQLMEQGLCDRNDLEDQRSEYRKKARPEYWETFGALPSNLPDDFYSTTWIGNHAVDTVANWTQEGNLLMVGFIKPHHPFDPPKSWCDKYNPDKLTILPGWIEEVLAQDAARGRGYFPNANLTNAILPHIMAYYYATISQIDFQVGRMIDTLKQKGIYENTMIIVTSDHGEYLGFHHMLLKGNHMYDPLMNVPLIIKYPKNRKSGTVTKALVNNTDVAPTILAQAGCQPGIKMKGFNLFEGNINREFVFAHAIKGKSAMARTVDKKLLMNLEYPSLFFTLDSDPLEMNNLYDDPKHQKEVERFKQAIKEWEGMEEMPDTYLNYNATQIHQPNVPPLDLSHRDKIIEYYKNKMDSF